MAVWSHVNRLGHHGYVQSLAGKTSGTEIIEKGYIHDHNTLP